MNGYAIWLYLHVKMVAKTFHFRFRTANVIKHCAIISLLYNVYFLFGAEFAVSGFIRTFPIVLTKIDWTKSLPTPVYICVIYRLEIQNKSFIYYMHNTSSFLKRRCYAEGIAITIMNLICEWKESKMAGTFNCSYCRAYSESPITIV